MNNNKSFKNIILLLAMVTGYLLYNAFMHDEISLFSKVVQTRSQKISTDEVQTFVINLDRTPQRYENVKAQLDKNNIRYERFSAVDGYNLEITNKATGERFLGSDLKSGKIKLSADIVYGIKCPLSGEIIFKSGGLLTAREFGCFCSHRDIWQKMVNEKIKYALTVEDDITLIDNFNLHYTNLLNKLPYQWDLIYLFSLSESSKQAIVLSNNNILKKYTADGKQIYSMAGYLINIDAAKKLLEQSKNFNAPVDHFISNELNNGVVKIYKTSIEYLTAPIGIDPKDSTIHEMGRENF